MSNPDVKICVQIMAFLYTLVFNGNEGTQDYISDRIASNSNFFLSIYKLVSVILQYSHVPKLVLYKYYLLIYFYYVEISCWKSQR